MNQGWIKLHRKIVEWEWYTETSTFAVFMHLILTCNFKPTRWRGVELEPGETIKALITLAEETKLSLQTVRTAIKRLKSTGELTQRQHGKHRILKLKSYSAYQLANTEANNELTSNQQGTNIESTLDKERKKEKKEKNVKKKGGTPSQKMELFIGVVKEKNNSYIELVKELSLNKNLQENNVSAELDKFVDYWTELNKSGTKQRWQLEKVFEVQKRISTWLGRSKGYNTKSGGRGITVT